MTCAIVASCIKLFTSSTVLADVCYHIPSVDSGGARVISARGQDNAGVAQPGGGGGGGGSGEGQVRLWPDQS